MFLGMEVSVVSTTIPEDNNDLPDYLTLISPKDDDEMGKIITDIKHQRNKNDIWLFSGSKLFRTLLHMGLVETVEIAVAPKLLGRGIPVLKPTELDCKVVNFNFIAPNNLVNLVWYSSSIIQRSPKKSITLKLKIDT